MKFKSFVLAILLLAINMASAVQHITVVLDWFVNPNHAPLVVAQQQGYFAKQGLSVKLITPADPSDGPKLVADGHADMLIDYNAGIFIQQAQGLPLVRVGTLFPHPLTALITLKSSGITTMRGLKGKKVATSNETVDKMLVGAMLKNSGLPLRDIQLVTVHYNLMQALLSKRVDAAMGVMRNIEPVEARLQGYPVNVILPEQNGIPNFPELIYVVNEKSVDADWVKKFLIAVQQGTNYLRAHPDKAWQDFIKAYPEANNQVNFLSWNATIPYFARQPAYIDVQQQEMFKEFLIKNGLVK